MIRDTGITRRQALALGGSAAASLALRPGWAAAQDPAFAHGFSPLGDLRYPPGFTAFDYVEPAAPKGGTLRLARIGTYDTLDTLAFPGRPPADLRLIYDRLVVPSDDEVASFYGVLASGIWVADDFSEVLVDLNPLARWHDGRPVTAEDVVFTFTALKTDGPPFYRQAFLPFTVTALSPSRVQFANSRIGFRDVVRQIATIPIHPAHVWQAAREAGSEPEPLGSGPYRLADAIFGRQLTLERVPDYWGAELGVNQGRWNFDRLVFDYYRDETVAMEAFRVGNYDLRFETDPIRWAGGYAGPALAAGDMQRAESPGPDGHSVHGLVYNLRRPLLADRRVRLALRLAYDFEAVNETLFSGAYARFDSVFGDTGLAAAGPADAAERAILAASGEPPDPAVLADPDPLAGLPPPGSRAAFVEAARLLDTAGLTVADGRRIDPATGEPVALSLLTLNPLFEPPLTWLVAAFDRLGIAVRRVQADASTTAMLMLDRDFDLATLTWSPARLPGTAERLLWHSALADMPDSYALSGIRSATLDAAIEALETARSPDDLAAAAHAFDRAFRHALVLLPLWRSSETWIAWWDRFGRPEAERNGFSPAPIERWWALDA